MGKIPRLRFPEFHGEWEEKKLGAIADRVMYGMNAAAIPFDGINKYLRITDINDDSRKFEANPLTSPSGEIEDKYKLQKGDIVFARTGASVGKSYLYTPNDGNLLFAGFLIKFSIINANPYFIFSQTLKSNYDKWIKKMSMRSGQPGINAEEYKELVFNIPSIAEQQKIADFLTLIDERIGKSRKIIEGLTSFKSAVSKKIFSQELRFKNEEGKNFPKWEQKTLGDCLDYEQPTNYLVTSTEYQDTFEVPVVTAGKTFILGYTDETTGIFNENLPVIIFDDFTTATQFVTFPFKAKSSAMKILKAKNNINVRFMYESMQMINYEVGGHGRHWISVFAQMEVLIPCFAEQNQIASFLCSLDNKIDLETALLQQLKLQKQYLLQQLFI